MKQGYCFPPSEVEADAKDLFGSVLQWLLAWFPEETGRPSPGKGRPSPESGSSYP